jgi:hypothetical protein
VKAFLPYRIGVVSSFTFLQVRRMAIGGYGLFVVDESGFWEPMSITSGDVRRTS